MAYYQPVTPPRDFTDHGASVEDRAREFARQDAVTSEVVIAARRQFSNGASTMRHFGKE
jgi:hypothetical protein